MKVPMGPPPPKNPNPPKIDTEIDGGIQKNSTKKTFEISKPKPTKSSEPVNVAVPYKIPPWSAPPRHPFFVEVLKDGSIIDQFDVSTKGAYMFGRVDLCDFVLDHPTISRFHAVLQFKQSGDAYLYDLASTHGTSINKNQEVTEEITWQTYKGQLTERQEKTREKIIKRTEKIANMKKEIDAIRSKDISQGGLTQGQQTQIARNEQRMSQILEELESLEETLNESIQESLGAHGGKRLGKNKGAIEDEDEASSDD
ncbi:hypothetical protein MKX01_032433 [Papaver californicum]|nr:hypothetical protein MKX01_032433 [Papaver californicum]